jgi:hypothetical protein
MWQECYHGKRIDGDGRPQDETCAMGHLARERLW